LRFASLAPCAIVNRSGDLADRAYYRDRGDPASNAKRPAARKNVAVLLPSHAGEAENDRGRSKAATGLIISSSRVLSTAGPSRYSVGPNTRLSRARTFFSPNRVQKRLQPLGKLDKLNGPF
jgi:hypothetical protein